MSTPAHVLARIAEAVRAKTGIDTDTLEVDAILNDDWDEEPPKGTRNRVIWDAVIEEAREYGLLGDE